MRAISRCRAEDPLTTPSKVRESLDTTSDSEQIEEKRKSAVSLESDCSPALDFETVPTCANSTPIVKGKQGYYVREALKRLAAWLGYDVRRSRYHFIDAFEDQKRLLQVASVASPLIFDVGANEGQTVDAYRKVFPTSLIHCFEPFPAAFAVLQSRFGGAPTTHLHNLAISDDSGEGEFFVTQNSLLNSLLPILPDDHTFKTGAQNVERSKVATTTLDAFVRQEQIEQLDVLKLDIQGAETKALRGATTLLTNERVRLVFLEVCFAPMYEGQLTFPDIMAMLDEKRYRLYGLYDAARELNGTLGWCNAIFVSRPLYEKLPRDFWAAR